MVDNLGAFRQAYELEVTQAPGFDLLESIAADASSAFTWS